MRKFSSQLWSLGVVLGCLTLPWIAMAQTLEEQGFTIAKEAEKREQGYVDSQADMVMILRDKEEVTSTREMKVSALEGDDEQGTKSLLLFLSPRDQKGTALLTFQHDDRADEQWLYLPALKRVKKIASNKKSGSFMGSEFSFEDIGGQSIEDYTYKFIKDEKYEDQDCFVNESFPKDPDSGYTRIRSWIDKTHYRTLKAEFYDRKQSLMKTMTTSGYKQYEGKFWRPEEVTMTNHQTKRSTVLQHSNIQFKTGLNSSDFNKNSLQRAR